MRDRCIGPVSYLTRCGFPVTTIYTTATFGLTFQAFYYYVSRPLPDITSLPGVQTRTQQRAHEPTLILRMTGGR